MNLRNISNEEKRDLVVHLHRVAVERWQNSPEGWEVLRGLMAEAFDLPLEVVEGWVDEEA